VIDKKARAMAWPLEASDKECRKCSRKFLPTRQTRHRHDDWRPRSSNHSKYFEKQAAL